MPRFESESTIDLSPKEYYDACSPSEQAGLCDLIMDEFNLLWDEEKIPEGQKPPRSPSQKEFNYNLAVLEENWIAVSKEDEKIINHLSKKYGGF